MSVDEDFPTASQEGPLSSKIGKTVDWFSSLSPSHADGLQPGLQSCERGQSTLFHHSPLELGSWQHGQPL